MTNPLPAESKLSEKRKQWLKALSGNDPNSINRQLTQLTWDSAAYRVINEARRFAKPVDLGEPEGRVQLNGLMHNLIERGFFISQMAAIRRLTDIYPLSGDRGVYSLTGLLDDILANRHLLTRRSILDAEGIEYDFETIDKKAQKFYEEMRRVGQIAYCIPHDCSFTLHDLRHGHIDLLAGVESSNRQPGDPICVELLKQLKNKITDECKTLIDHVNKYIAHAAAPESRVKATAADAGISLAHLWDAQKHLCEVAGFLSIYVLGSAQQSFLPVFDYDQFQYIERPLVDRTNIPALKAVWTGFSKDCGQWGRWRPDAI